MQQQPLIWDNFKHTSYNSYNETRETLVIYVYAYISKELIELQLFS
jgi:hypothetical protein